MLVGHKPTHPKAGCTQMHPEGGGGGSSAPGLCVFPPTSTAEAGTLRTAQPCVGVHVTPKDASRGALVQLRTPPPKIQEHARVLMACVLAAVPTPCAAHDIGRSVPVDLVAEAQPAEDREYAKHDPMPDHLRTVLPFGGWAGMHWKGGGVPPPPGRPAYAQPLSP